MNVAIFSTKSFDREFLEAANTAPAHELVLLETALNEQTYGLAGGCPAVCVFVNDSLNRCVLMGLADQGTRLVALRCAGFSNVDLGAADDLGFTVLRVPAYSPHAVAEHTVGLILSLNRKLHRAYARVREQNFSLEGLMGFDLRGRTVGIVGTGRIGAVVGGILAGFGCYILAYDPVEDPDFIAMGAEYVSLQELAGRSDIITLHCPLMRQTQHLVDEAFVERMKPGVMLINTSRGALIDTKAVVEGLKSGRIGYLGIDVYEEEGDLFFRDLSNAVIQDDVFSRLLTFPNVLITAHQAFFTREALSNIAETTIQNITSFERGDVPSENRVGSEFVR
ncbi:MAG: 2-hydroxyacid dehydrogenase [Phycisphaerae bacterium]